MRSLFRRFWMLLSPPSEPEVVLGTRPGYVWWPERSRWVDEAESYKPTNRTYALVGPVCVTHRGWLRQEGRARALATFG